MVPMSTPPHTVRQLRVVIEAEDYDEAVALYRDVLGMQELEAYAEGGDDRVVILDAGRATIELATPKHKRSVDRVEAGGRPSRRIRLALEVDDTPVQTQRLVDAGARLTAEPVMTPWRSVNSRLETAGDLEVTLFQETETAEQRAAREGFARDDERS
jgi:catechol 2,3-dioxygenase-like lactoylglutathione lyase family enzyme